MDASFVTVVQGWQSVYVLIGEVAATLTGLLFVAVSLNLRVIMDPANVQLRSGALRTFIQFSMLIAISITFQIPGNTQGWLGLTVAALAAISMAIQLVDLRVGFKISRAFLFSNFAYVLTIIFGILIAVAGSTWLYILMSVMMWTLISCLYSAWVLLAEVGAGENSRRIKIAHPKQDDS